MSWSDPDPVQVDDVITAAQWNQDVVDNVQYLYDSALGPAGVYDSGWFSVTTSTTYTKAHGLGVTPRLVQVWHAAVASPGASDEVVAVQVRESSSERVYAPHGADATNVYVQTQGNSSGGVVYNSRRTSVTGYYRVLAWI